MENALKPQKMKKKSLNSAKIPRGQFRKWVQCISCTQKPYDSHQNFDSKCRRKKVSLTTYELWRPSWILAPGGIWRGNLMGTHWFLTPNSIPERMQVVAESSGGGAEEPFRAPRLLIIIYIYASGKWSVPIHNFGVTCKGSAITSF